MAAECGQGTEGVWMCQQALGIGGQERSGEGRAEGKGPPGLTPRIPEREGENQKPSLSHSPLPLPGSRSVF